MTSPWLFPRTDAANGSAGAFADAPWRIVLHTTETTADPDSWVGGWQYPSHIVCDFERNKIRQCLPLDEAGKALENRGGGVETNRDCCIQIEINGNSADVPGWPEAKLRWIGEQVIAPIVRWIRSQGSDINLQDTPAAGAISMSATVDAPQRMSFARWDAFNGICGHRHVPENEHWDSGALDISVVARYAAALLTPTPKPDPEELTMADITQLLAAIKAVDAHLTEVLRQNDKNNYDRFVAESAKIDALSASVAAELGKATGK